jgi:hypothetical protein
MAEYYPLLARAISAQTNASKEMRDGIYERARKALLGQLRAHDPPLPEEDIERESRALEEAILRIEAEQAAVPAAPPARPPAPAPKPQLPTAAPRAPIASPRPMSLAERAKAHRANLGSIAGKPADSAPGASQTEASQAGSAQNPARAPVELGGDKAIDRGAAPPAAPAPIVSLPEREPRDRPAPIVFADPKPEAAERPAIPKNGLLWKFGRARGDAREGSIEVSKPDLAFVEPGEAAAMNGQPQEDRPNFEPESAESEEPPRTRPTRPLAPSARPKRRGSALYWGLGSAAVVIVAGVAVLAFLTRDAPQTIENQKIVSVAPVKAPAKIIDRIGLGPTRMPGEGSASLSSNGPLNSGAAPASAPDQQQASGEPPPAAAVAPPPSQSVAPAPPAAPAANPIDAQAAPAPLSSASAPQTASSAASAQPVAAVAQRAALLVQAPTATDPQAISTYVGTVVWSLDTINQGPGKPPTLAVRAEINVPQAKFKASMLLEKNDDDSLPASHTMELRFMPDPGGVVGEVKQIDTPQMRKEESPAGDALAGIPTPITTNYFLVGLAKGNGAQSHNIDLMRQAGWFDVPMLLNNGKIAKITFEKGVAGQKALDDAFAAWSS